MRRPGFSTLILLVAVVLCATALGALAWSSRTNVVNAGFWFDEDVTFELVDPSRLGGPLTLPEQRRIEEVARAEIEHAFADLRLRITDRRDAFYTVRVRPILTIWRRFPSAGESRVFGPLGGEGAVSFMTLAAQAIRHAPPAATRADIVDGIGRGIGRAAVHEFVHQILPHGPVHTRDDEASYEYWLSDRPAQYYGDVHWSVARPMLLERLARH